MVPGSADLSSAPGDNGGISHIAQGGPHLIINWDSFNIAEGKQVVFRQPYPSAVALNRVIGNSASQILGQLNANGQIFLVNTNGILFGPNSQVNVGALAASTLALSNRDFLGGRDYRYATQGKSAKVVNQGSLNARPAASSPWSAGRWTTRERCKRPAAPSPWPPARRSR